MQINFEPSRWDSVKQVYDDFWNRKTDHIVYGAIVLEHPLDHTPDVPLLSQSNCHDFSFSPEQIADRILLELSQFEYYGDAFPMFGLQCFGPGIVSAFLGSTVDNSSGNVWFLPSEEKPIDQLDFKFDADNIWFRRIADICIALKDRFEGRALIGIPDMGGVLDILSIFLPGEQLLFDLYDAPQEVHRVRMQIEELWLKYYNEFLKLCSLTDGANTDWSGIYSSKSSYIVQSDFAYMIGPDMFEEFVLPTIKQDSNNIDNIIYHLDGVGQLPHLDMLLAIEKLDAVQWVPGSGAPAPDFEEYFDIYKKILNHDKQVLLQNCTSDMLFNILQNVGGKGLCHPMDYYSKENKDTALEYLNAVKKY